MIDRPFTDEALQALYRDAPLPLDLIVPCFLCNKPVVVAEEVWTAPDVSRSPRKRWVLLDLGVQATFAVFRDDDGVLQARHRPLFMEHVHDPAGVERRLFEIGLAKARSGPFCAACENDAGGGYGFREWTPEDVASVELDGICTKCREAEVSAGGRGDPMRAEVVRLGQRIYRKWEARRVARIERDGWRAWHPRERISEDDDHDQTRGEGQGPERSRVEGTLRAEAERSIEEFAVAENAEAFRTGPAAGSGEGGCGVEAVAAELGAGIVETVTAFEDRGLTLDEQFIRRTNRQGRSQEEGGAPVTRGAAVTLEDEIRDALASDRGKLNLSNDGRFGVVPSSFNVRHLVFWPHVACVFSGRDGAQAHADLLMLGGGSAVRVELTRASVTAEELLAARVRGTMAADELAYSNEVPIRFDYNALVGAVSDGIKDPR